MEFTILGQQYNEDELRQLSSLRVFFEKEVAKSRRTGMLSQGTQIDRSVLSTFLNDEQGEAFVSKLLISSLINEAIADTHFFFNKDRFKEAIERRMNSSR